jgi:hypothetical protein
MNKILSFYKSRGPVAVVLSVVVAVLFVVTVVEAATTLSTDISTDGTLSVTGASTLTGGVISGANITVPAGFGLDTAAAGALNIGTTTATSINIGDSGVTTSILGSVTIAGNLDTTGLSTLSGGIDVAADIDLDIGTSTANAVRIGKSNSAIHLLGPVSATSQADFDVGITIGNNNNVIEKHFRDFDVLDFPAIAANDCEELTLTVTGAEESDVVGLGIPNNLASASSTLTFTGWVSAANTVTVRACQIATQGTSNLPAGLVVVNVWHYTAGF